MQSLYNEFAERLACGVGQERSSQITLLVEGREMPENDTKYWDITYISQAVIIGVRADCRNGPCNGRLNDE